MELSCIYQREKPFQNHKFPLKKGDAIYMFSDGYLDQFGGEKGHKFMKKQFRELLQNIAHLPMKEQYNELEKELQKWMGEKYEQVDDIIVFGIRL